MALNVIKPLSEDIKIIFRKAKELGETKYFRDTISSNELFLAMFSFLASKKDEERYSETYSNLKEILNSYGISGKTFKEQMLQYYPMGNQPESGVMESQPSDEIISIKDSLKRKAIEQERTMEVEDLIIVLFNDNSYKISTVFEGCITEKLKSEGQGQINYIETTDNMYNEVLNAFKKKGIRTVESLDQLPELKNLNKFVDDKKMKFVNADEKIKQIQLALSGRTIKCAVLTGPAGCGKTHYVHAFADAINRGEVEDDFKDKIIYELNPAAVIAGSKYRGEFEEKMLNIISMVKAQSNVILFIDEVHQIVSMGNNGEDESNNAAQILKPFISNGDLQIIGCTTSEEYTKSFLKDKAFKRRFQQIKISEPNKEETLEILKGLLPVESKYFGKDIQEELIEKIILLSNKYTLDECNPAKSIILLESACAYSKIFENKKEMVDVDDVIECVRIRYDIKINKDQYKTTETELKSTLLGQDKALDKILENLKLVDMGLCDPQRPMGSFILAGPSGTGKTEACKIIAKNFFGSENALVKINMGEYSSEIDVTKIKGASAGYVGYNDETALIKGVRENPRSLVLFDEIEKAHPSVQKILLNILDEGYLQDNKGNKISFRNTIIVFTTNLGCTNKTGTAKGLGIVKQLPTSENVEREVLNALKQHFRPEFLGRIDDVIIYDNLTDDVFNTLIERYKKEYLEYAQLDNIEFTDDEIKEIKEVSEIATKGARGLRAAVKKELKKAILRERVEKTTRSF